MKIHVLTSMSRTQFLAPITAQLKGFGVEWNPIVEPGFPLDWIGDNKWIKPITVKVPSFVKWPTYFKLNAFLQSSLESGDWYCILNDDDLYQPNFFDRVPLPYDESIVIVSACRGDRIPPGATIQTIEPAIAARENLHIGGVGMEQIIAPGSIWQHHRFPDDRSGDGMLICEATSQHRVKFVPEAVVLFNYFEPGRYSPVLKSLVGAEV